MIVLDQTPPCAGLSDLFDSLDLHDHREARTLCANCPVILQCATICRDVRRSGGIPNGTWAGRLYATTGAPSRRSVA